MSLLGRFKFMIINPSKAFWDITHKPKGKGGGLTFLLSIVLYGFLGMVMYMKMDFSASAYSHSFFGLFGMFLLFFLIGFVFIGLTWGFSLFAQTIVAKYSLNILPEWRKQVKILAWAYFPSLIGIAIHLLIISIGLPKIPYTGGGTFGVNLAAHFAAHNGVFIAADIVLMGFFFGYVPILQAIGIREIYDNSTTKSLIGSVATGIVLAIVFITTRTSFGVTFFA